MVPEYDPREWMEDAAAEQADSRPCPVCNSADHEEVLLLCDGCNANYHTHCIDLDSVPRGPWFCMECEHALGPDVVQPVDNVPSRDGGFHSRTYYFPRTQASMRRARQRARSDNWQGAWGRITGRVWDALELDLDYEDEDDSTVFEGLQRSRQLREREREEHERWQQRLNIASRLGARDVFLANMGRRIERPQPTPQTREERIAWGDLDKARDIESRKRKSRSATAEPNEEQHHEPERKLKRPRTRRLPPHTSHNGESSSSAAQAPAPAARPEQQQQPPQNQQAQRQSGSAASPSAEAPPSFLSSLLKEVEMSAGTDEETLRQLFGPIPSVNDAPSPARSPAQSHGSITPPPNRSSSPVMTLSSHIAPIYAAPSYLPTRGLSLETVEELRSPPAHKPGPSREQSSPENSDSEHRGRRRPPPQQQANQHGLLELRQPQPQRGGRPRVLPRSHDTSPARHSNTTTNTTTNASPNTTNSASSPNNHAPNSALTLEMKESISKIVRGALKPHWRSKTLTAEQYEAINRDISRKIYEEVRGPVVEVSEDVQSGWERLAVREVARAVAGLRA